MPTTVRRWTGAVPVTAAVLALGLCAALISPAVRHTLSTSFQRQPERYVELYFADESKARGCPAQDGTLKVVATVRSHLAAATALAYLVDVIPAAGSATRSVGVVATTPGRTADFGASVLAPASAYTVQVSLPGRTEHLVLHCPGTDGS